MNVSIAEAKSRLPELIHAVEAGDQVVITRHGKPVAQIQPAPSEERKVRYGTMRGRIQFNPGWDKHVTLEEFLAGDL